MSVMRIKDTNGNWQEVAALTGIQGPEGPAGPAGDTKVFVANVTDLKKADATAQEILDAVADGCVCILRDLALDHTYTYMGRAINSTTNKEEPFFVAPLTQQGTRYLYASIYVGDDGTVTAKGSFVTTPSPFPLKLTGAVEAEFDGSKGVTVEIPEGGSSSKYAQPEWGAEIGLIDILPEIEFTVDEDFGAAFSTQEIVLTAGNTYTVTYNGTDYSCVAVTVDGMPGVALGNLAAMEETAPATDDPFFVMTIDEEFRENYNGACLLVVPLDGSTTFTLAIKSEGEIIHTIPSKYVEGGGSSKYAQPDWGKEAGAIVLPETTVEVVEDSQGAIASKFSLVVGQKYTVDWNGTTYTTTAVDIGNGGIAIGNLGAAGYPVDVTEEPYIILRASDEEAASAGYYAAVLFLDGSTTATLSIMGNLMHKIPAEYVEEGNPPLIVNLLDHSTDVDFDTIAEAIDAGRTVYLNTSADKTYKAVVGSRQHNYITFVYIDALSSVNEIYVHVYEMTTSGRVDETSSTIYKPEKYGLYKVRIDSDGAGGYTTYNAPSFIFDAYNNGKSVCCYYSETNNNTRIIWQPVEIAQEMALFSRTYISDAGVVVSTVKIESDGSVDSGIVTVEERTIAASGT